MLIEMLAFEFRLTHHLLDHSADDSPGVLVGVDVTLDHRHVGQMSGEIERYEHCGFLGDEPGDISAHRREPLDAVVVFGAIADDIGKYQRGIDFVEAQEL